MEKRKKQKQDCSCYWQAAAAQTHAHKLGAGSFEIADYMQRLKALAP